MSKDALGRNGTRHAPCRARTVRRRRTRPLVVERLEDRSLLTSFTMSVDEQILVELINRARNDPAAEAVRYGIDLNAGLEPGTISAASKQPLAPHQLLINAARGHSQDMVDRNFFSHTNPDGQDPGQRMEAAGYILYPPYRYGENIAQGYSSAYLFHRGLFLSPGHRRNLLLEDYREIGVGLVDPPYNRYTCTEKFATRQGNAFLTGVAFSDDVTRDSTYSAGESLANVTITARLQGSGATYTTTTGPTGGFSLQLPSGVYDVRAEGGDLNGMLVTSDVAIGSQNVKVDFVVPDVWPPMDAYEPNDDVSAAADLGSGDCTLHGLTAHTPGDRDVFQWTAPANGPVTVEAILQEVPDAFHLFVYDAQGHLLGSSSGDGTTWSVSTRIVAGDSLLIMTEAGDHTLVSDYTLRIDGMTAPVAVNDRAWTTVNTPVEIKVLLNDESDDAPLLADTLQFTALPQHGQVHVRSVDGTVVFSPDAEFLGVDRFTYVVSDDQGNVTAPATVQVTVLDVTHKPWQNPHDALDVNYDEYISPIDSLVIINHLQRRGVELLVVPSSDPGFPPPFLDVNGDDYVSPIDALRVINFLNTGSNEGEGEGAETASCTTAGPAWPVKGTSSETRWSGVSRASADRQAGHSRPAGPDWSTSFLRSLDLLYATLDDVTDSERNQPDASCVDASIDDLEEFVASTLG